MHQAAALPAALRVPCRVMDFHDPGKNMTWPQYVAWKERRLSGEEHERAETSGDQTEEPMEHDAPHPSTIDPDPDEEWPDE